MANLIDEIVSQKAFDELERLKRELAEAQKSIEAFYKQTGSMPKFGGSGTATSELEKMVALTKRLTEQIQVYGSVAGKALVEAQQAKRELVNETKLLVQQELAEEGSINQLRASLNLLTKQYESMGKAAREGLGGKDLHARIMATRTEVDKLEQSLGNYKRNVGNYTNATFQLSQVFRELPAFTFSATTGIMALSNNLPMLADAFKQVREQGNSVMQTLAIFGRSIFSFGNIFTLAIAAFTIFNKEIMQFLGLAEKVEDKVKKTKSSLNEAEKAFLSTAEATGKEVVQLQLLYSMATDVNLKYKERKAAVDELQKTYPAYLGNLKDEEIMAGNAATAYERLYNAMTKRVMFEAFSKKAQEEGDALTFLYEKEKDLVGIIDDITGANKTNYEITQSQSKLEKEQQEQRRSAAALELNQIRAQIKLREDAMKRSIDMAKDYAEGIIDPSPTGGSKSRKDRERNRIEELKKLYEDERNLIEANYNLGRMSFMEYQIALVKIQEDYFRVRIGAIRNLTEREKHTQTDFLKDLAKDAKEIIAGMKKWIEDSQVAVGSARKADMEKMAKEGKEEFKKQAEESVRWFKSYLDKQPPATIKVSIKPEPIKPEELAKVMIDIVNKANELMKSISDATFNAEMANIDIRQKKMDDYYDNEEKRIKQSYSNKQDQEKMLLQLEARRSAQEKVIERERTIAARKRAQAQKAYDIANIITTTASAIMEALEQYKGTPLAFAMAAIIGATGAAQIAAAQAAPLPQFAQGTENSPEGYAVVGEKGHELVIEPSGKKWVTPAKDTITYLKKGSKVIPNDKLMTMVRDSAYVELANMNMPVTPDLYGKALIDQFERLSDDVKDLKAVMSNKDMRVNIVGNFDHYMHVKRNIK